LKVHSEVLLAANEHALHVLLFVISQQQQQQQQQQAIASSSRLLPAAEAHLVLVEARGAHATCFVDILPVST
jgi:hypothetical protein